MISSQDPNGHGTETRAAATTKEVEAAGGSVAGKEEDSYASA